MQRSHNSSLKYKSLCIFVIMKYYAMYAPANKLIRAVRPAKLFDERLKIEFPNISLY